MIMLRIMRLEAHEPAVDRRAIVEAIGEFARREIGPRVQEYDEGEYVPPDRLTRMAELGFFGGVIPERWGGLGLAYGISPDHRVGRFLRDSKVLQMVEGSNDLHRALIAEIALGKRKG